MDKIPFLPPRNLYSYFWLIHIKSRVAIENSKSALGVWKEMAQQLRASWFFHMAPGSRPPCPPPPTTPLPGHLTQHWPPQAPDTHVAHIHPCSKIPIRIKNFKNI